MDSASQQGGVKPSATVQRGSRARAAWMLAAMLFVASAYFYQDPEWNGNSRFSLTRALVEHGNFQIDDYISAPGWATEDRALFNGHYYSDKAIGSSLLAAPFYFLIFKLSGIMEGPDGKQAIINGQFITVGQTIDGATVTEIGIQSADLKAGDITFRLRFE